MLHQPKPSELVTFTCAAHPGETGAVSGATFAGTVCSGRSSFCSFHSGISMSGRWLSHPFRNMKYYESQIGNIVPFVGWKTDIKWHR